MDIDIGCKTVEGQIGYFHALDGLRLDDRYLPPTIGIRIERVSNLGEGDLKALFIESLSGGNIPQCVRVN